MVVRKSQVTLGVNNVQGKVIVGLTRGCAFLAGWISPASVRSRTSITDIRGTGSSGCNNMLVRRWSWTEGHSTHVASIG